MSSISSSDRANQTDEIRRIREDYESKEAEETKKKNKEMRAMNEKQDQELKKVQSQYTNQLETLRNKHSELIDERDKQHNEDISKMREFYVDSLRKKTTEESRERDAFKQAFEGDIRKEKEIAAQQKETDERGFKQSLAERDRVLGDRQTRGEESLHKGLEDRTEHLNAKHKEEMKNIVEDRDRRVGELRHTLEEMKSTYNDRIAAEERAHRAENDRRTSSFDTIYRNQEHNNAELIKNRDALLAESRHHLNEEMGERMSANDQKSEALRNKYAEEMESRTGNIVKEAKAEVSRAKNDQVLEAITNRRLRDIDHNHLVRSYQAREEDLTRQKQEVFEAANEMARKRVDNVIGRTDKLVTEANRKNRMEQGIQDMRVREALAQQDNMTKDQVQLTNNRADQRVRKVMQATTLAQQNQIRQHEENVDDLRHSYQDKVQNQREAQLESMKNIYSRMDQKLRDLEAHLMKKHDDAVEYYETKLDSVENQRKADLQKLNQTYTSRWNQREKAVKMEEDSLTKKYEQKMAIQEDIHQQEMNRMEKRHQEQVQAVVQRATAAQNNRKA